MLSKCLLLTLAALGLAACSHNSASPPSSQAPAPIQTTPAIGELGSRLPDFTVADLHGQTISSQLLQGKVVLVDFWATWCQPCKKEMPGYQKLRDLYGPKGLVVIGFKFDTMMDTEDPLQFAKRIRVHYPLAVATDDLKQKFGGVEGLPTTMLYDRQGILRAKVVGFEYTDTFARELLPLL